MIKRSTAIFVVCMLMSLVGFGVMAKDTSAPTGACAGAGVNTQPATYKSQDRDSSITRNYRQINNAGFVGQRPDPGQVTNTRPEPHSEFGRPEPSFMPENKIPSDSHKNMFSPRPEITSRPETTPAPGAFRPYVTDKPQITPMEPYSGGFRLPLLELKPAQYIGDTKVDVIKAELAKSGQQLAELREKAQNDIQAEIEKFRVQIDSIYKNKDLDSNFKNEQISKMNGELKSKKKMIAKKVKSDAKMIMEQRNARIDSILNSR